MITFLVDNGMSIAQIRCNMDIRFVSSLTPEDESTLAPALIRAVGALLDQLPLAYTMRIETTGGQTYQHSNPSLEASSSAPLLESRTFVPRA